MLLFARRQAASGAERSRAHCIIGVPPVFPICATVCLPCVGIEDWVVRITREWFTFQPGRPAKHCALPQRHDRHRVGLQDALEVPDEFLVDIVQGPVF